jgi:hypothetical protein
MRVELPRSDHDNLSNILDRYAAQHELISSSGSMTPDPRERDQTRLFDWLLQTEGTGSTPGGVVISISANSANDIALIEIETTCFVEVDWRPLWGDFEDFVTAIGYRRLR